jgi:NosR/NirI family nitrous oxide reductase transcriptional regulator
MTRKTTDRVFALGALILIGAVWMTSSVRTRSDLMPIVRETVPEAGHIVRLPDRSYVAWTDNTENELIARIAIGTGDGYGGPLQVSVAVDGSGTVIGAVIADDKETPAWMARVLETVFMSRLIGKKHSDPFRIGEDVDGVSGATCTVRALADAAADGSRSASESLGLSVEPQEPPKIVFGVPEFVLMLLFAIGFFGHQQRFPYTKQARWVSMIIGLVVLGFIYNSPLTLAYITKFLLGYWPQWQTNLYWYFLIGGILFVFTVDNKNPYCQWCCPFGAAQECMGAIGGAKNNTLRRFQHPLIWAQRLLTLAAILLGVWFRNPGVAGYELFGTLFGLLGSSVQFAALGLVLVAVLFIKRSWCNFLCPIRPVTDLIRLTRQTVKESWQKIRLKTRSA